MDNPVRVLVVDDDPDVRDLLDDYLSGQGYAAIPADGAAAARSLLDAEMPDLVLLDLGLPGEDGLSLARHIRRNAGAMRVPFDAPPWLHLAPSPERASPRQRTPSYARANRSGQP